MSGLLFSVWVHLKCQRCEMVHETDVRFHCPDNREVNDYFLGDRVSEQEALVVGEVYEGNADRYCFNCFRKWAKAQALCSYDALTELIEAGQVLARDPVSGNALSKQDVLEHGKRYTEEEAVQSGCIDVTGPFFTELELTLANARVIANGDTEEDLESWGAFLDALEPLLDRRMRDDGWTDFTRTWEDFRMHLDDDRRIVVEDERGDRLELSTLNALLIRLQRFRKPKKDQ